MTIEARQHSWLCSRRRTPRAAVTVAPFVHRPDPCDSDALALPILLLSL